MKTFSRKKYLSLILAIIIIFSNTITLASNEVKQEVNEEIMDTIGEDEKTAPTEKKLSNGNEDELENSFKELKEEVQPLASETIQYNSWEEVPETLAVGTYDFSNLPEEAGIVDNYLVKPKEITIDDAEVTIIASSEITFKYLQINLKNGAKLTIKDLKIDNYRGSAQRYNSSNRVSAIKVLDNTDNKLIVKGENNYLTGNEHGAAIGVNAGTSLTITGGENSKLEVVAGYITNTNNSDSGAGIGGDYQNCCGDINFTGKIKMDAKTLGNGAAIGSGYLNFGLPGSKPKGPNGAITIKDDVIIDAHSIKNVSFINGAGIGSGQSYGHYDKGEEIYSPIINIEGNATVNASTRGSNVAAIGNAYGTNLGQINIKDNATVIAVNNAVYNPEKYKENFGFGDITGGSSGPGIGFQLQNTIQHDNKFSYINISENPTIITGGNEGGIISPNGKINISGGTIKIFTRNGGGIGIDIPPKFGNDLSGKINISGKRTSIDILGRETVTQERKDNDIFNYLDDYEVGDFIDNFHPGIGLEVANEIDGVRMNITIKDASVNVLVGDGAAIGGAGTNKRKIEPNQSYSNILIDGATINAESIRGTGIGSGIISNDKWDVDIKNNSQVIAKSTDGAGIGAGVSQFYKSDSPSYAGNIEIDNSTVTASSNYGAGIGGGRRKHYDDSGKDTGMQTPRNIDTEGTLKILNNAIVKAYSGAYFAGSSKFFYRDAITAKLLSGSMQTMASHTFNPLLEIKEDLTIKTYDEFGKKVTEMTLPKGAKSYAYSIPNSSGVTYSEKAVDSSGNICRIGQYENTDLNINYREKGRHPEDKSLFTAVTEYKGVADDHLDDNTVVDLIPIETYIVKYNSNGADSGTAPIDENSPYGKDEEVTVLDKGNLAKEDYTFDGWNTKADGSGIGYNPEDKFNITENTVLYAQWVLDTSVIDPEEPTNPTEPSKPERPTGTIKEITLIGGRSTLTENIENQLMDFVQYRLAGKDRYGTSAAVAKEYNKSNIVLLASGEKYTDELTATVLANKLDAPIMLTRKNAIPAEVKAEINRLGATKVILVGGNNSISEKVEKELSAYTVERIGGPDRYDTAILVGNQVRSLTGSKTDGVLVDGTNFPDAIAMTSMAVEQNMPILLTKPRELPASTAKTIKDWSLSKVTIGGGVNSVSGAVANEVKKFATVDRIAGADRYETSVLVAEQVYVKPKHAVIASGEVFPDAIVGAPYAAKNSYPIVLSRGNYVPEVVMDYILGSR
ncbi:cell wall-binding repeat-containing protein [Miniphocaeibacter halophilus]|uniref:Cell wall-binding repeat-containing protein n=1 Tax=Miniphocaeibacter halophilus TaxID=2931922 RepID=A0AC61MWD7_9FIRM|nr:cell wall-binding repeat-containing protein [Miniphocaeibacter halophilus]QQK08206.1 cell wall-binding repeat-containing protein [Miniphocaeibacter halophilus]